MFSKQGEQAGYQLAALAVTLGIAIVSGLITGFIIKLPFIEQINKEDDFFDDGVYWHTPDDFLKNE
jgi:ammonium transporter Rh